MARTIRPGSTAVLPWCQRLLPAHQSWMPASALPIEALNDDPASHPALSPEDLLAAARAEAGDLLAHARAEAQRLTDQAQLDGDHLRTSAYQEGFSNGREQGSEAAAIESRRLRELAERIAGAYQSFCLEQTPHLAALATDVAEKLLHEQLSLEPERAVTLVRRALEQTGDARQLLLYLHPEDLELVRAALPAESLPSAEHHGSGLILRSDPSQPRGGCRIATEHGEVQACPVVAMGRLKEAVATEQPGESAP